MVTTGANDPRWETVGALRDEASRISDDALAACRAGRISGVEAFAAIGQAHLLNQQATALVCAIGASYTTGQAVTHLPRRPR